MRAPHTFRDVQSLASEAGLVMSREAGTRHIRFRERSRPGRGHWTVASMDEAVALIQARLDQNELQQA